MSNLSHSYVLGDSRHEQERLLFQGRFLRPYTDRYLRAAGLTVGMRVLDVGCGIGDVALIAADIVGPQGNVTCIDRDAMAIKRAEQRAVQHGCSSWINFCVSTMDAFESDQKFDALIGRYVLLYQSDPAANIRHLLRSLKPGAIVAFHEVDFLDPRASDPPCPIFDQLYSLMGEAFRRSGASPDFGRRIGPTFKAAGLPFPTIVCEGIVGGGRASYVYSWAANSVISVAPQLERLGLSLPPGIPLDYSLATLLEEEALREGSQILAPLQYGAWCRVP